MIPTTRIKAFGGTQNEVLGSCTVYLYAGKRILKVLCQVTDTDECFLIGRQNARVMRYVNYPEISPPAQFHCDILLEYKHTAHRNACVHRH